MDKIRHLDTGNWLPLMDYAIKRGISLSTLRRHIKANKVTYKVENGRYLLWDDGQSSSFDELDETSTLQIALHKVEKDLQRAQEEIAELKMLIALYEEKIPQHRFNN
jgi:hypothetical protein